MDIHFHDALGIFLPALGKADVTQKSLGLQRFHPADVVTILGILDRDPVSADGLEGGIWPNTNGVGHQPQQFSRYPRLLREHPFALSHARQTRVTQGADHGLHLQNLRDHGRPEQPGEPQSELPTDGRSRNFGRILDDLSRRHPKSHK